MDSGIIGIACITFDAPVFPNTLSIGEFDIVFNTDFTWSTTGEPTKEDVHNISTHEFGHTLFLDDLEQHQASELTMFGFAGVGEVKKRTLGQGDSNGLHFLYGN